MSPPPKCTPEKAIATNSVDTQTSNSANSAIAKDNTSSTSTSSPDCPICYLSYTDRTIVLPCQHNFCYACISTWICEPKGYSFPLCRTTMSIIHRFDPAGMTEFSVVPGPNFGLQAQDENQDIGFVISAEEAEVASNFFTWIKDQGPEWSFDFGEDVSGEAQYARIVTRVTYLMQECEEGFATMSPRNVSNQVELMMDWLQTSSGIGRLDADGNG